MVPIEGDKEVGGDGGHVEGQVRWEAIGVVNRSDRSGYVMGAQRWGG